MEAAEWIKARHQGHLIDRGAFLHFSCAACGERAGRSAFLIVEPGLVKCYQPSCWLSFKAVPFKTYVEYVEGGKVPAVYIDRTRLDNASQVREVERCNLPEGFTPIHRGKGFLSDRARRYVESRGFDPEWLWEEWRTGYTLDGKWYGRIIHPFHAYGQVVWFQGRDFTGRQSRWDNPTGVSKTEMLFGRENIGGTEDLWAFEGLYNALTMGDTLACATLGKSMSDTQAALLSLHDGRVLVAYDEGAWVDTLHACAKLDSAGVDAWAVPFRGGDANEIGREATLELGEDAVKVTGGNLQALLARSRKEGSKTFPGKGGRSVSLW